MSRLDLVYLRTGANPHRFLHTGALTLDFDHQRQKIFFNQRGVESEFFPSESLLSELLLSELLGAGKA